MYYGLLSLASKKTAGYGTLTTAWIAATGETDTTILGALNTLESDLTTYGLTSKIKALYPYVGGTSTKHSYNFMNTSAFQITFYGGWTHDSNGILPNGTNAYGATGYIPDNNGASVNNNHILIYSRTASASTSASDYYDVGSGNNSGGILSAMFTRRIGNGAGYDTGDFTNNRNAFYPTDGSGCFIGKINSDLTSKVYRQNVLQGTKSITNQASLSPWEYYIGGFNEQNSTKYYSQKRVIAHSFGLGLTDTEAANFYTAVQAFQTTLSRNV